MRTPLRVALVVVSTLLSAGCMDERTTTAKASVPAAIGSLQPAATMNDARADHTATLLRDGSVLITGGMVANGVFLDTAELFNPKTNRFETLPRMRERRVGHTASLLPDGRVIIAGGISGREFVQGNWRGVNAKTIEIFDPARRKFSVAGSMRIPRTSHAAITLPKSRVVFLGGYRDRAPLASVEIFDPTTGHSDGAGHLASAREGCGCVLLDNGKILLTGGSTADRRLNETIELYNPELRTSTVVGTLKVPRRKHAAVLLDDGRVLIAGGSSEDDWNDQYSSAEIFDPTANRSTKVTDMANQRFKIRNAAVRLKNGRVLVAGGKAEAEVFEPQQGVFAPVAGSMGGPHYFSTATLLEDGRVLIAGGYGNGTSGRGPLSTKQTWLYVP